MEKQRVVFVGMSGGVDSSVAAYLLKKQGYSVVGVFIKVWHPDFMPCHWERERLDAMRVAAHLEIPFLTCDAEEAYKTHVAQYFINEYEKGRTPNPDIMCNTHVKFGVFYDFARAHGADFIATGHYARTHLKDGTPHLLRGIDADKDQSYFLWNIRRDALAHTLFPLGDLTKPKVRRIAQKAKIPTATKDESQGICFLGHVDIPAFLSQYIELREGAVLDQAGVRIGSHDGVQIYTIGQRHGFRIDTAHVHTEPYYVTAKDRDANTLTVSLSKPTLSDHDEIIMLRNAHLFQPDVNAVQLQTRYRQRPISAHVRVHSRNELEVAISEQGEYPAVGQSGVLYVGDEVVGGGMIDRILKTD